MVSVGYVPLVLLAVPNDGKSFADMERAVGIDALWLELMKEVAGYVARVWLGTPNDGKLFEARSV